MNDVTTIRDSQGRLHCANGPAWVSSTSVSWYINGTKIFSNEAYQAQLELSDLEMFAIVLVHGNVTGGTGLGTFVVDGL